MPIVSFMDQKEVASGDCCIILGGKEGVSTIVSNSEKKVWLLLKRLESFIHLQIGEHEKSLPRVEILWSFRFPLHLELVARSIQPSVGSCARFYDPHSPTPPLPLPTLSLHLRNRPKLVSSILNVRVNLIKY